MKIVFILSLISLTVFAAASILRERRHSGLVCTVSCGLTVILALTAGLMESYLLSLGIGIAVFSAVSYGMIVAVRFIRREGAAKLVGYMAKAMLVVLLLEAVCFNFNSYHLWKGGYEQADLDLGSANKYGFYEYDGQLMSSGDTASIEFTNVDRRIGTIRLDLESTDYKTDYSIDFTDETNASYYLRKGRVKGSVFNDIDATRYIVCDFSGKVGKFTINFKDIDESIVTLKRVTLNADHPTHFSYLRVVLILLSIAFVWLFRRSVNFRKPLGRQYRNAKAITAVIIAAAVILCFMLSAINMNPRSLRMDEGDQISQELVDAFEAGQVELKAQPSEELLALENPYDLSAREELHDKNNSYYRSDDEEQEKKALWDHLLYNGKYYSYYGAGPVLLLFLPYHILTGHYLASQVGALLFNILALIFLGMTFLRMMKKLFPDIPLSMYTAALVMIFAACGIWYCTVYAAFYEVAESSGLCFTVLGAYFLITSNVIGDDSEAILPGRAALSSMFLAVAVTCRPTTAIWCAVAVGFIAAGVLKLRRAQSPKAEYIKYLLCALLPFVVIGGAQMMYNYARFGSLTDFGIDYSLTVNDFTHAEFHTQLAAIGFFEYLFAPPSFSGEFPYVQSTLSTLGVNGFYYIATKNGCGLFFRALPMLFMFGAPFALRFVDKGKRVRTAILFAAAGIVAPCVIIASVWESGYGVRYMMDFAWEMLVCAFLVMFTFYRNLRSRESRRIYEHLMLIAMFLCVFVNMGLAYSYYYPGSYVSGYEAVFESFGRMFGIFNT